MKVTRRTWLKAVTGVPFISWLAGCGEEQGTRNALEVDEDTLTALVDTIVPADQDPGAVDAGIHLSLLAEIRADETRRQLYVKGLKMFDAVALERDGRRFSELDLERRVELLTSMVRGMRKEYGDGRRCFIAARNTVLTRFYSGPEGWQVLDYKPPIKGY